MNLDLKGRSVLVTVAAEAWASASHSGCGGGGERRHLRS